ncbi:hypothetical protein C6H62_02380 [Clostridium chauvoei]|nr:hypothetical protein C6H62_02380 [Clostridium chauvoei]
MFNDSRLIDNSIYMLGYFIITNLFIKLERKEELLVIAFFSIYGITEGFLSNIFLNLSLVFLADLIYKKSNKKGGFF